MIALLGAMLYTLGAIILAIGGGALIIAGVWGLLCGPGEDPYDHPGV